MKLVRNTAFAVLLFLAVTPVFAQNLTGIWRGYFITEDGSQYKYELQIEQPKNNSISGVSYSYLDTRFYGKATLTGNFIKGSGTALVQEIKTVELKMSGGSVACIMKCRMVYAKSGNEEFLEGEYTSKYEKGDPYYNIRQGGNCGGGTVYLRKVPTSDFYTEPFLRKTVTKTPEKTETVRNTPQNRPQTRTTTRPPIVKKVPQNTTTKKTTTTTTDIVKRPKIDTIATNKTTVVVDHNPVRNRVELPITIRERKNELTKTLSINNDEIEIRLYDNGEIDDDTVSIYLDGKLIISNKRLSDKPISYKLRMDENIPEHTLVMVAENMGRIPPNTSLMIVQDGDTRYQVSITSTEQKNAMVRFRYQKLN